MTISETSAEPPASCRDFLFDATLQPPRSLGVKGFRILMGFITFVSIGTGLAFYLIGAWPILGFYGLDVLAIYIAFKWSYRSGRLYETVRLTAKDLEIQRIHPGGRWETWNFQPYWVRMNIDQSREDDPKVGLTERGVSVALGAFLSKDERLDFARALQGAILRAKLAGAA